MKNSLKVCHVTSAHSRYDIRIFEKECSSLAQAGFDVYLVVNDEKPDEELNGVKILSTGQFFSERKKRMTKGTKAVFQVALRIDADVYHFHDPELLPYCKKMKRFGKKVVFDSHEDYYQQIQHKNYIPASLRKIIAYGYKIYENNIVKAIDGVVFPAYNEDGTTIFDGKNRNPIIVGNLPLLKNDRNIDIGPYLKQRIILQAGSLTRDRGLTEMVVAGYKTGAKVVLAGSFENHEYKKLVEEMPEYECVEYKGQVRHNEVEQLIRHTGVGIAVMHNVGQYANATNLPTKVYEYASFGLPIIGSTNPPSLKKFLEDNHCGIVVDPMNIDEFVDALNYLFSHEEEAIQMGQNGKQAIEKYYSWDTDAEKLVNLYKKLTKC